MSARSQLTLRDLALLGVLGAAARRTRSLLSVLGIAVAVASLVSVLGLAASSQARLVDQLGAEGNLLTVAAGQTFSGNPTPLPPSAQTMVAAIAPVLATTAVGNVSTASARRTAAVPMIQTGGISVLASQPSLVRTLGAHLVTGSFLGPAAQQYPEVVLGYNAAQNLGIATLDASTQIYVGTTYMTVIGLLAPVDVAPEMDDAALVSFPIATTDLGLQTGQTTRIYLRVDPDQVAAVAAVLPFTASPEAPEAVDVRRPSDVLLARIAAKDSYVTLFLGLGAVALLVGGVGIANIMVISVLERRAEIGLRRSLGARAVHIGLQFFVESLVLTALGGIVGVGLGAAITAAVAHLSVEPTRLSWTSAGSGLMAAVFVGALAGLYPAIRAARLAPADALRAA